MSNARSWFLKGRRLTQTQRKELLAFMKGPGKTMPDSEVARVMHVSEVSVYWLRRTSIGKVKGGHRKCEAVELQRRKKISGHYCQKRKVFYIRMWELQCRLERDGLQAPLKQCKICGMPWFQTKDFYFGSIQKTKSGSKTHFFLNCRFCEGEVRRLKRQKVLPQEIAREVISLIPCVRDPQKTRHQLYSQFQSDSKQRCPYQLMRCSRCNIQWYWSKEYFHSVAGNRGHRLLKYCLACPISASKKSV